MSDDEWSAGAVDGYGEVTVERKGDLFMVLVEDYSPRARRCADVEIGREQSRDLGAWLLRHATPEPAPEDAEGDVLAEVIAREEAASRESRDGTGIGNAVRAESRRICEALDQRRAFGLAKYGKPLARDNGRDHLRDALDELLDAMAYAHAAGNDDLYDSARSAALVALRAMDDTTHTEVSDE